MTNHILVYHKECIKNFGVGLQWSFGVLHPGILILNLNYFLNVRMGSISATTSPIYLFKPHSYHCRNGPKISTSANCDKIILNNYPLVPITDTPECFIGLFNAINISFHKTQSNKRIGPT